MKKNTKENRGPKNFAKFYFKVKLGVEILNNYTNYIKHFKYTRHYIAEKTLENFRKLDSAIDNIVETVSEREQNG